MSVNSPYQTRADSSTHPAALAALLLAVVALLVLDVVVGAKFFWALQENEAKARTNEGVVTSATSMEAMMIGDVGLQDEIVQSAQQSDGSYRFDFVFDHIADQLDDCNLCIIDQETVLEASDTKRTKKQEPAKRIMDAPEALAATLDKQGFNIAMKSKDTVHLFERNGLKVGVLTYASLLSDDDQNADKQASADGQSKVANTALPHENKIREDVAKVLDAGAEMLIACPRWGNDYDTQPSDEQLAYAKLFCDLGVDVIFGCHPHMLQPVELLQNAEGHRTVCFYSVGTFVTTDDAQIESYIGGIARVSLERDDHAAYTVGAASLIPTVTCRTIGPHMSAYQLKDWTYALAEESYASSLTPDYVHAFCAQLLGRGFDDASGVYVLDLTGSARIV